MKTECEVQCTSNLILFFYNQVNVTDDKIPDSADIFILTDSPMTVLLLLSNINRD